MRSLKQWREEIAPAVLTGGEQPTQEDYNFYNASLSGKVKMYLDKLVGELEAQGNKLSLVRRGFIVQEVMDALGLNPSQVTRLSNNIKRGIQQNQMQAQQNQPQQPQTQQPMTQPYGTN